VSGPWQALCATVARRRGQRLRAPSRNHGI